MHIAPQTWNDGVKIRPVHQVPAGSRTFPPSIRDLIKYDHVVFAGAISIMGDDVKPDDPVLGYRCHQWQKSDNGVVGMSSAIEAKENAADDGLIWAAHANEEVGNWEVFLPSLVRLYRVITDPEICPVLLVQGRGQRPGRQVRRAVGEKCRCGRAARSPSRCAHRASRLAPLALFSSSLRHAMKGLCVYH